MMWNKVHVYKHDAQASVFVRRHTRLRVVLVIAASLIASRAPADDREGIDFFERKIRPVLVERCYGCHSAEAAEEKKLKAGLLLDTRAGIRQGGETGPAVVPREPDKSELIAAIMHESFEMPPDGKLADDVIADFRKGIEMGAPDPRDGEIVHAEEAIDIEGARKLWAFQRPQRHEPPTNKHDAQASVSSERTHSLARRARIFSNADWPRDDIDRFVLAAQERHGLTPVADASPEILIRRLYYDLIGLPPLPSEIDAWKDRLTAGPAARARSNAGTRGPMGTQLNEEGISDLVDSLLDSPHFGERWGRHWLDVARYSESNGAPDKNGTWPVAYRYRDYVIDALNNDKPYDEFILEQVAGDLLAAEDEKKHADKIVATGLLALGMKTAGKRMDEIDEQMDTLGKSVLGLGIGCARCHDHKFDPIPTRDYYSMAGIFFNSLPQDGNSTFSRARFIGEVEKKEVKRLKDLIQELNGLQGEFRKLRREIKQIVIDATGRYDVALSLNDNVNRIEGGHKRKAEERLDKLAKAETDWRKRADEAKEIEAFAVAMKETGVKGKMANVRLHIRGSEGNLGDEVPRGLLTVFPSAEDIEIAEDSSGRLELAQWLASDENPLTARVIVNRVWHHLLGRGIVPTTDNFGATGQPPTHPELLDTLAVDFMEDSWSIKRLIRRIVLSRTYALSDTFDAKNYATDPDNVQLWRARAKRLNAEAIRDYILAASGRLDREPMQGSLVKSFGAFRGNFDIDDQTKRTVYMPALRGGTPDMLLAFNFPPPSLVVGNRQSTTVPTQALVMMNSPWGIEQADYIALRLFEDAKSDDERVSRAYRLIFGRSPTDTERDRAMRFVNQICADSEMSEYTERDSWSLFCQSLLGSAEFLWIR